jgi:hypothetical protein
MMRAEITVFLMDRLRHLAAAILLVLAAACASTGATFRSGVGDAFPEHPPYYAGAPMDVVGRDTGGIGHLPIVFQRGVVQPGSFDPPGGTGTALAALLADMNIWLDSLGVSTRLDGTATLSAAILSRAAIARSTTRDRAVPPDVRFGCIPENGVPGGDCSTGGDGAAGRGRQQLQLSVGRPSPEWIAAIGGELRRAGLRRALVLTLELGDQRVRQEGLAGTKALDVGTGHRVTLPWLTSLDTPVSVLQLTAALVDGDGRAVRIGAEGFLVRRTRLAVSAIGGRELLGEQDVATARTLRREDLPGAPLAWQVAMRELVGRVTGREVNRP